jgi:hypothetical protein
MALDFNEYTIWGLAALDAWTSHINIQYFSFGDVVHINNLQLQPQTHELTNFIICISQAKTPALIALAR